MQAEHCGVKSIRQQHDYLHTAIVLLFDKRIEILPAFVFHICLLLKFLRISAFFSAVDCNIFSKISAHPMGSMLRLFRLRVFSALGHFFPKPTLPAFSPRKQFPPRNSKKAPSIMKETSEPNTTFIENALVKIKSPIFICSNNLIFSRCNIIMME